MTDQDDCATGGMVTAKPGDPPLLLDYGCSGVGYLVPVNFGITIPRDDIQIVLLDAEPVPADVKHALDQLLGVLGTPARTEREP